GQIKFPYKSGYLGFRECKLLSQVIEKLPSKPDLVLCDGHGIIHPKRFGEAVHLGFALDIPTIGVAKNPLIGYFNWGKLDKIKGNKVSIWTDNPKDVPVDSLNHLLGYLICLNNNSKPVFISKGYKTTLDLAVNICLDTTKNHRQPEPLYLADRYSRDEVNKCTN
ncbi:MAG: endonuclease V, partial [Promethearchaeota archaeon]